MTFRAVMMLPVCVLALSAQTKKILLDNENADLLRDLQSVTPQARIVQVTPANILQEIADADAVIGSVTPEQVRAAKQLKWVQSMSAGVEDMLFLSGGNDLRDSRIVLTNNKVVQGPEIADHAMAMLLMLTRRLLVYHRNQEQGVWRTPQPFPGIELRDKTAVVIGVGGIGTQIAVRANAFGMKVIGVDPEDRPFLPFIEKIVKPDQLDEVLPRADVVFISAPHTEKSNKMMGPRQFDLMKPHSYFIAVSRGGIYYLNSLVQSLESKHLDGAGVDVTDPEPLPKGHALWKFDNVIITPHVAGRSDQDRVRMVGTIKENIRRFVEDRPLVNVVDKQKGY